MGKRTAAEVMKDVQTSVGHRREKVRDARRKRRTLADMVALFEQNWCKGQQDAGVSVPTRIVGKYRALLKNQLLKRVQGQDFDTDDFAYWVTLHWQAIGAQYFAKARSYPEYPAVAWFIKCVETYVEAYENREFLDEYGTRSHKEILQQARAQENAVANTEAQMQSIAQQYEDQRDTVDDLARENKRLWDYISKLENSGDSKNNAAENAYRELRGEEWDDLDELNLKLMNSGIDTSKLPSFDDDDDEEEEQKPRRIRIKRNR